MVKGRQGFYLEAWKFGVYVSLPVIASVYYANPETQKKMADYWKFIEYPENPNTHVKEKIEELAKEKAEQRQQRDAYQEQLRELERSAQRAQRKHQLYLSGDKENDTNSIDTGVAGGGGERASRSIWGRVAGWFPGNSA